MNMMMIVMVMVFAYNIGKSEKKELVVRNGLERDIILFETYWWSSCL